MSVCKINHLLAQMDNIVHLHLYSRDEPKVLSRFAALVYRYVNNEMGFVLQNMHYSICKKRSHTRLRIRPVLSEFGCSLYIF